MDENSKCCCINNKEWKYKEEKNCCSSYDCEERVQPCHYQNTNFKTYSLSYQISHANETEKVVVQTTRKPRVKDLLCEIEKSYNIPVENQRLIYRGIPFHHYPEKKLEEMEIFPMSTLRLSGTRKNYQSSYI